MVCNVEKEMIKGRKVIKQMLNKKYNFPLNKVVVVPRRINYTIHSSLKGWKAFCSCSFGPQKKNPTP